MNSLAQTFDIRTTALITCITALLSVVMPMWDTTRAMAAFDSTHPRWWMIPAIVATTLVSVILPVFYFALYES